MSARDYPPGFFTELMRTPTMWPPGFRPEASDEREARLQAQRVNAAQAAREAAITKRNGYGDGTIKGMGRNAKGGAA